MDSTMAETAELSAGFIKQSVFEGLFVHMVHVQPGTPFAAALQQAGYDVAHPRSNYPSSVLQAVLAVAGRELFPGKPLPEAQWAVGRRFVEGFFKTLAGRTVALLLPVFGAEGLVKQLPRFFLTGNSSSVITVTREGERSWRFELRDRFPSCEFAGGIIEELMRRAGLEPQVTVVERGAGHFVLRLRW